MSDASPTPSWKKLPTISSSSYLSMIIIGCIALVALIQQQGNHNNNISDVVKKNNDVQHQLRHDVSRRQLLTLQQEEQQNDRRMARFLSANATKSSNNTNATTATTATTTASAAATITTTTTAASNAVTTTTGASTTNANTTSTITNNTVVTTTAATATTTIITSTASSNANNNTVTSTSTNNTSNTNNSTTTSNTPPTTNTTTLINQTVSTTAAPSTTVVTNDNTTTTNGTTSSNSNANNNNNNNATTSNVNTTTSFSNKNNTNNNNMTGTSPNNSATTITSPPQVGMILCPQSTTPPPPPPPEPCKCEDTVIDLTETPKGIISPGYENTFISIMVLSCLGSFALGTCVAFIILTSYDSSDASRRSRIYPNGLLRKRSITTGKGERLIIEGGDDMLPKNSITAIEKAHADGMESLKNETAQKKKEMADRVAARLLSRKNKMAMKLAKSEALKTVDCFKSLQATHMAMVIGKMRLVTYDEGSILCEQGDDANEFFVCMEGTLKIEINNQFIRTMGDCEFLGEKALLGKNATRGATVTASSKAEVFVLSRHQFELLENDGLPIKEIVANVKHKVEQYEKDDEALQDVKLNELRAMQLTKKSTHISRQSSSMDWANEQKLANDEKKSDDKNNEDGDSDDEELLILDDD